METKITFGEKQDGEGRPELTTTQAAVELGVTPDRIRAMIAAGSCAATQRPRKSAGGMEWVIAAAEVNRLRDRPGRGRPPKPA